MGALARLEAEDAEAAIQAVSRAIVSNPAALDVRRVAAQLRALVEQARHAPSRRQTGGTA